MCALIVTPRHRPEDLAHWEQVSRADAIHARTAGFRRRVEQARATVRAFASAGRCYAGVSWGKDSTVLAHMVVTEAPDVPLVWVRVPQHNPDCPLVRDAFLRRHPAARYDEIASEAGGRRTSEVGFAEAAARYGDRYLSGVRAEESAGRRAGVRSLGLSGERSARPLGWWRAADVWAYLAAHDLPIHPAYAYSAGGAWPRDRLRVGALGGHRGTGAGRSEWERAYYPP